MSRAKLFNVPKEFKYIKLFSSKNLPFGPLSNNAIIYMNINGKRYGTVTNYILANTLLSPINQLTIQTSTVNGSNKKTNVESKLAHTKANLEQRLGRSLTQQEEIAHRQRIMDDVEFGRMDIWQKYRFFLEKEFFDTNLEAVEQAYNSRIAGNENLQQLLIDSGNVPIIYASHNPILGMGENHSGQNVIGIVLMQIRHNLQIHDKIKSREAAKLIKRQRLLDVYKAYLVLQYELRNGNFLESYLGKNASEILDYFSIVYPMFVGNDGNLDLTELGVNEYSEEFAIKQIESGKIPIISIELKRPGYMAYAVRKDNLRKIREQLLAKKDRIILEKFTEWTIKKKRPELPIEKVHTAAKQLLRSAPGNNSIEKLEHYNELLQNVANLYYYKLLDDNLLREIDEAVNIIEIPSEEDILNAESMITNENNRSMSGMSGMSDMSESSSDGENNPLKKIFGSDDIAEKDMLIRKIMEFTGKSYRKYKKYTVEKLREKLNQYQSGEKNAKSGEWLIIYKHPQRAWKKTEIKSFNEKPDNKMISKALKKYNRENNTDISQNSVYITWNPKVKQVQEEIILEEDIVVDDEPLYQKSHGDPIYIYPFPKEDDKYAVLSPLHIEHFMINHNVYSSVSVYITALLLSRVGVTEKDGIMKRGMGIIKAREELLKNLDEDERHEIEHDIERNINVKEFPHDKLFYNPEECNYIYENIREETFKTLMVNYNKVALSFKFRSIYLQNLLLLTGQSILLWNSPHDDFLGSGSKDMPGENIVGKELMNIRKKLEKSNLPSIKITKNYSSIVEMVEKDEFIRNWVEKRLEDMCKTVYKMKQYLWRHAGTEQHRIDEDITVEFVQHVLEYIYQPCDFLKTITDNMNNNKDQYFVPEFFSHFVGQCKGMIYKFMENYDEQLKEVNDFDAKEEKSFEEEIREFMNIQYEEYQEFLLTKPSEQERKEFRDEQENTLNIVLEELNRKSQRPESREHQLTIKHRRDFNMYLDKILAFNEEKGEIYRNKIIKLRENTLSLIKNIPKEELIKIGEMFLNTKHTNPEYLQLSEKWRRRSSKKMSSRKVLKYILKLADLDMRNPPYKQFSGDEMMSDPLSDIMRSFNKKRKNLQKKYLVHNYSSDEISNMIRDFTAKQISEYRKHFGSSISSDDITLYEETINRSREKFRHIKQNRDKEIKHMYIVINDVARVYWYPIIAMLYFATQHSNPVTVGSIRRIITSAELLNSTRKICDGAPFINETDDKCIASSLLNLLVGIQKFKHQYADDVPLGKPDILTAASILLGRDLSDTNVPSKPVTKKTSTIQEIVEEDNDIFINDNSSEINFFSDEDDNNEEYYDSEERNEDEDALFGFGNNIDLESVKIALQEIAGHDIPNEVAQYFVGTINIVKSYALPSHVKSNRINYFATISEPEQMSTDSSIYE